MYTDDSHEHQNHQVKESSATLLKRKSRVKKMVAATSGSMNPAKPTLQKIGHMIDQATTGIAMLQRAARSP